VGDVQRDVRVLGARPEEISRAPVLRERGRERGALGTRAPGRGRRRADARDQRSARALVGAVDVVGEAKAREERDPLRRERDPER
jgi:hypothetical protein